MAKLQIEIISEKSAFDLLKKLAKTKFNADIIHNISDTNTINIDNGMNDIRAVIEEQIIQF